MTEYGRIHTDGSRSGGQPIIKTQHCPNCEATEQKLHDFRQKVSDTVEAYLNPNNRIYSLTLHDFIIPKPKPDPLEQVIEAWFSDFRQEVSDAASFRTALEAYGLEIREKNDE